jgi:drug/metabolite transporter (DMT)-like permease
VDLLTIVLMLLAGSLHAGWHGLVKSGVDQTANLAGMGIVAALPAMAVILFAPIPPATVWLVLLVSVAFHVGYKLCVANAYANADLGEAFPLARGAVPLFATAIAFLLLGQTPSAGQCAGIVLISGGLMVLALARLRRSFDGVLLAATAGAGLAVAAYSVVDSYGTRLSGNWVDYTAWLIVVDNVTFLLVARLVRGRALWATVVRHEGTRHCVRPAGIDLVWRVHVGVEPQSRRGRLGVARNQRVLRHPDRHSPASGAVVRATHRRGAPDRCRHLHNRRVEVALRLWHWIRAKSLV